MVYIIIALIMHSTTKEAMEACLKFSKAWRDLSNFNVSHCVGGERRACIKKWGAVKWWASVPYTGMNSADD